MRITPAQVAAIRTGNYKSCFVVAVMKPNELTAAAASYKWTTFGRPVTFGGVKYPPHASAISLEQPVSEVNLNDEESRIVVPDLELSMRLDFDRTGHIGWRMSWARVVLSDPPFAVRRYVGRITAYQSHGDTRDLTISATGPFRRYDQKAGGLMTDRDQRERYDRRVFDWSEAITYETGNVVRQDDAYWRALRGSTGVKPGTSDDDWVSYPGDSSLSKVNRRVTIKVGEN